MRRERAAGSLAGVRWAARVLAGAAAGALLGAAAHAAHADTPGAVAEAFAVRLARAMSGGPVAIDRLFVPAMRDSAVRVLDARSNALFTWSDVHVEPESARFARAGTGAVESALPVDCILRVRGTAKWDPQAFGVATALWRPLHDESAEVNRVVRREAWRLEPTPSGWLARERVGLSPFHVRRLTIRAGVFPNQDVFLVESAFSLVAQVDGVESARFFLDRRAEIYDLLVNDAPVAATRGSELGSLGLEGFSPELESSFRLPRALARGDEILVKFRTRAPLVHLRAPGIVTTLPLRSGPFRERAWIPIFGAEPEEEARGADLELAVVWPKGAFERALLPGEASRENASRWPEEDGAAARFASARSADFVLFERDDYADDGFDVLRGVRGGDPRAAEAHGIRWEGGEASWEPLAPAARATLDPHPRSRRALVVPLAELSMSSSRDLSSELQDLLPLDADLLDELFDDSATDAERGGGDRSAE